MVAAAYSRMRLLERHVTDRLNAAGIDGDIHSPLPASWFAMQGEPLIMRRVELFHLAARGGCPWSLDHEDRAVVWQYVGAALFDHHRRAAAEQLDEPAAVAGESTAAARPTLPFRTHRIGRRHHAKRA